MTLWLGEHGHFCSTTAALLLGLEGIPRTRRITVARRSVPSTPPWLKVTRLAPDDRPRLRSIRGRRDVEGERFVLDFFFVEARLGIECHSIKWHLGHEAFKNDVRRHRLIASAGIEVLFFTWDEVTTSPARVEAEVRAAVDRRRSSPATPFLIHTSGPPDHSRG